MCMMCLWDVCIKYVCIMMCVCVMYAYDVCMIGVSAMCIILILVLIN